MKAVNDPARTKITFQEMPADIVRDIIEIVHQVADGLRRP
jgi:hypothetical protein